MPYILITYVVRVYLVTVIIYHFLTPQKDTFKCSRCTQCKKSSTGKQKMLKRSFTPNPDSSFLSSPHLYSFPEICCPFARIYFYLILFTPFKFLIVVKYT